MRESNLGGEAASALRMLRKFAKGAALDPLNQAGVDAGRPGASWYALHMSRLRKLMPCCLNAIASARLAGRTRANSPHPDLSG